MNPKFCPNGCLPKGETLDVKNNVGIDIVTHLCICKKCKESFIVEQSIKQWRDQ
jgi:hypothetical protein